MIEGLRLYIRVDNWPVHENLPLVNVIVGIVQFEWLNM